MPLTSSQRSFLNQLHSAIEVLDEKHTSLKCMIYGDSGVGKTVAAMSIAQQVTPPTKSIIFIDSAEGWVSLDNHKNLKVRTNYIPWTKIENLEALEALAIAIGEGIHPWSTVGTIVLDESSSLANDDLDRVVFDRSKSTTGKDPDTPMQPDYNTTTNRVRKFYGDLIKVSELNVILTAHLRSDKDNMQREKISPSFLPKLSAHLRGMLHLVAYMTAEQMKGEAGDKYIRQFQCHPTSRIVAKTRIGGIPPVTDSKQLVGRLKEWLEKKEETLKQDPPPVKEVPELNGSESIMEES